jgi:hypothetical protein
MHLSAGGDRSRGQEGPTHHLVRKSLCKHPQPEDAEHRSLRAD